MDPDFDAALPELWSAPDPPAAPVEIDVSEVVIVPDIAARIGWVSEA